MPRKDITDLMVVRAYAECKAASFRLATVYSAGQMPFLLRSQSISVFWCPIELLADRTGEPYKVCYRAAERAARHHLIDVGVSLRTGWLSDEGVALLEQSQNRRDA